MGTMCLTKMSDVNQLIITSSCFLETKHPTHFEYVEDENYYNVLAYGDINQYAKDHGLPVIIWWKYFSQGDTIKTCGEGKCFLTQKFTRLDESQAKAFLFYGTVFNGNDLPLPRRGQYQ